MMIQASEGLWSVDTPRNLFFMRGAARKFFMLACISSGVRPWSFPMALSKSAMSRLLTLGPSVRFPVTGSTGVHCASGSAARDADPENPYERTSSGPGRQSRVVAV
jgi:hypothetical protein